MESLTLKRPSWDQYFMDIAKVVATRSNCVRRQVAAVVVRDKQIISTGYNGTPRGVKNCNEGGCPRCNSDIPSGEGLHQCLCSHAEENAIVQAAYHGIMLKGTTLYTTFSPCLLCAKMIINAGINEVVYHRHYTIDDVSMQLLQEAGVKVRALREDENTEFAPVPGLLSLDDAVVWREQLAASGKKLVVTNGCFDILHRGHVSYLQAAAQLGDALLVLVNSDNAVKLLKGSERPINSQNDRAFLLCSLKNVSAAVIFDSTRCDRELAALRPDVYTKAGDYSLETLDAQERAALLQSGSKIVFMPFVNGFSTTGIINRTRGGK